MNLDLSHNLFNCDDVKGGFYKDSKIGDWVCGMKMLKQKMREKKEGSSKTPVGVAETV